MYMQNQRNNSKITSGKKESTSPITYYDYLKKHIGRKIKVEYLSKNVINEYFGQLIKVGEDFLSIKLPSKPLSTAVFQNSMITKIIIEFEEY